LVDLSLGEGGGGGWGVGEIRGRHAASTGWKKKKGHKKKRARFKKSENYLLRSGNKGLEYCLKGDTRQRRGGAEVIKKGRLSWMEFALLGESE